MKFALKLSHLFISAGLTLSGSVFAAGVADVVIVPPVAATGLVPVQVIDVVTITDNMPGSIDLDHDRTYSVVTFNVLSNGCTNAEDFIAKASPVNLGIVRIKADFCKGVSTLVTLQIKLEEEIVASSIRLLNPMPVSKQVVY